MKISIQHTEEQPPILFEHSPGYSFGFSGEEWNLSKNIFEILDRGHFCNLISDLYKLFHIIFYENRTIRGVSDSLYSKTSCVAA